MQILIDNFDGNGSIDYSMSVQFGETATIVRELNKPSFCTFDVVLGRNGLPLPSLNGRVQVISGFGVVLFTGYVAVQPQLYAAGQTDQGVVPTIRLVCVSDELLIDRNVSTSFALLSGLSAQQDWAALSEVLATSALSVSVPLQLSGSSRFEVSAGTRWSEAAGDLAASTGSAYRSIAGAVEVLTQGDTVHPVCADDPGLVFESLTVEDLRWLANDITVCGREEATAYVTEVFQGDGVTASFLLSEKHFSPASTQKTMIADSFQGTSLNPKLWKAVDAGANLALTAAGLTCLGGTGREAETTVRSIQEIELGGSLTLEATGVQVASGSAGAILGLYAGDVMAANCFCSFSVRTSPNGVSISVMINGATAGSSCWLIPNHLYTLRLRVCCPEMERTRQSYFYLDATGWKSTGGGLIPCGGLLEFEVQDVTSGMPGAPVILYSGLLPSIPAVCTLGLLDSGNLNFSVKGVNCSQSAPLSLTISMSGSALAPQFIASAIDGGACSVSTVGSLAFYPANVPGADTLVYVNYRARGRAVARRAALSSQDGQAPQTSTWIGSISKPAARSSIDCDNAATAILAIASSQSAAVKGTYTRSTLQLSPDVWPGDMLELSSSGTQATVDAIVRKSQLTLTANLPESVEYKVAFANDWAESLSIKLSSSIPADVVLPETPTLASSALLSLSSMTVTNISKTQIVLSAGASAPTNGGFEVRRRDNTFGPGIDSDLVLRTGAQIITIARAAPVEQYYLRMYDGAIPPSYSLFSAAVFINVPM